MSGGLYSIPKHHINLSSAITYSPPSPFVSPFQFPHQFSLKKVIPQLFVNMKFTSYYWVLDWLFPLCYSGHPFTGISGIWYSWSWSSLRQYINSDLLPMMMSRDTLKKLREVLFPFLTLEVEGVPPY